MFEHLQVHYVWLGLLMFLITFIIASSIYPLVLRVARVRKIYDNPDARKLQRRPVPVLGGVAVYFGILLGVGILLTMAFDMRVVWMMVAMTILLVVGVLDDIGNLPVNLRFLIEIAVVVMLILLEYGFIDNFSGIFGIEKMNYWAGFALSLLSGVGIINAINLIDGVDGYSSGFTFLSCLFFAIIFYVSRTSGMAIICLICAGAVLPFFLHNVFGKSTKMFVGDGGTLMIGTMMTIFCFGIMATDSFCYEKLYLEHHVSLIPLGLAILGIPVFDTLRVMFSRMMRHQSPFHPDKTHLHHLFIDMGFSHVGTTFWILSLNCLILAGWAVTWAFTRHLAGTATMQAGAVVLLALLFTVGFYPFMRKQEKKQTALYKWFCRRGQRSHIEDSRFWNWMQKAVDGDLFSAGKVEQEETEVKTDKDPQ